MAQATNVFMTPEEYQKQKQLLEQALDLPESEQEAWINNKSSINKEMQQQLLLMIKDSKKQTDFLKTPNRVNNMLAMNKKTVVDSLDYVKGYTILKLIGEGGMGLVYAAKQDYPADREVALKVLKYISNQQQLIDETQSLVKLNHPNIATLHEVDSLPDGKMYMVMELIDGEDIVSWCHQYKPNLKQILNLFKQLCDGVAYAHEKRVIHCDIKPSNVLVTHINQKPIVKVIDFGISQLDLQYVPNSKMAGTASYLCPEALVQSDQYHVNTRRDVYALGILLHQVIAGRLPKAGKLDERINKDLQAIIGKAIAQSQNKRYASPRDLSLDIDRYLNYQVVKARPPSFINTMRCFLRRHVFGVIFSFVLIATLAWGFWGQVKQAKIATHQASVANQAKAEAENLSEFLLSLFELSNPDLVDSDKKSVLELVENAKSKLLALEDPGLSHAQFMHSIGSIFNRMDKPEKAIELIEKALIIRQSKLSNPAAPEIIESTTELGLIHRLLSQNEKAVKYLDQAVQLSNQQQVYDYAQLGLTHNHLGNLAWQQKDYQKAENHHKLAVEYRLQSENPNFAADSYLNLGAIYLQKREWEKSEEYLLKAQKIYREEFGEGNIYVELTKSNIGVALFEQQQWDESEINLLSVMSAIEKIYGSDHRHMKTVLLNLSRLFEKQQSYEDERKYLFMLNKLHTQSENWDQSARTLSSIARSYSAERFFDLSHQFHNEALLQLNKIVKPNNWRIVLLKLALINTYKLEKKWDEALVEIDKTKLLVRSLDDKYYYMYLRAIHYEIQIYLNQGLLNPAELLLTHAKEINESDSVVLNTEKAKIIKEGAILKQIKGDFLSSELDLVKAAKWYEKNYGENNPFSAETYYHRAINSQKNGSISQSIELLNKAIKIQKIVYPNDPKPLKKSLVLLEKLKP